MVDTLSYFSFQPVLHDRCNKGCGMCNPVCGMVHIKEPLLLIRKSSLYGSSGFCLSLSEWSFTICPTPYNREKKCVECCYNKTFPSFLLLSRTRKRRGEGVRGDHLQGSTSSLTGIGSRGGGGG